MQASYNSDAFVHLHFEAILFSNISQDQKALPDKYQDFLVKGYFLPAFSRNTTANSVQYYFVILAHINVVWVNVCLISTNLGHTSSNQVTH